MTTDQFPLPRETGTTPDARLAVSRKLPLLLALPFIALEHIGRSAFYCVWYLAFYVLCMFRPFTGLMVLAAIVMVPVSIVVYRPPRGRSRHAVLGLRPDDNRPCRVRARLFDLSRLVHAAGCCGPIRAISKNDGMIEA